MKKLCKKMLMLFMFLIVTVSLCMSFQTPVMAKDNKTNTSSTFVKVQKNKSFNKDGKFYMSFNLSNVTDKFKDGYYNIEGGQNMTFDATVVNSAGKTIFTWKPFIVKPGKSLTRNLGANYKSLPSGKYTFYLRARTQYNYFSGKLSWYWKYTITHKNQSSISIKSYNKYRDSNGIDRHKFNIQCNNIKGKRLVFRLYNSDGELVFENTGSARKTDNEVGWFTWSGKGNYGNYKGIKCKSGTYTVEVFFTGSQTMVTKSYRLLNK